MPPGCPDEDQISAYVGGGLDPEGREQIEAHLDRCEACSRLVADLVRIYADDPASISGGSFLSSGSLTRTEGAVVDERRTPELLAPGSAIGRYRTLECVGIGGMGVVYAAYDPQLDRRVALKLLLDDAPSGAERKRARLLREAQSMAKLTHPNVITVHDVGTWHGQVFVAMEFIEGGTLKSWMRERQRTWPEIRDTLLAAGRGLASAHAAGLVHRDFKPDNVLIGNDGQVRVTDFGLARWEDGAVSTGHQLLSSSGENSLSFDDKEVLSAEVSLTRTGALVGTPAYMAPELYAHEVADAATDQFAFCVALYEALYGERPFQGQTLAELATNVVSGDTIEFPTATAVPRYVRNALRRGLSRRRRDRFPSMTALLGALEHRVARKWGQFAIVGVPAAVLGVGLWATAQPPARSTECDAVADPMQQVWNPERRAQIARAFTVSTSPLAAGASDVLLDRVEGYAQRWAEQATSTCDVRAKGDRATFVELSERCLAGRRIALDVALQAFHTVDDADIARAASLVESIERDCTDEVALLSEAPPPAPSELRATVDDMRLELARVEGHQIAGEYAAGVALAESLDARAEALGHDPLEAETKRALGQLLDFAGKPEEAMAAFEEAELLATASRYHNLTASALAEAVYVEGVILARYDEARRLARRAEAAGKAAGLDDVFRSGLLLNQASVEFSAGNFEVSESLAEQALKLRDREAAPMRWADAAFNLASIRMSVGRNEEAIGTLRAYIEIYEAQLGHVHPEVSIGYHSLAIALLAIGDVVEGEKALRTALKILDDTVGESHPLYANPLSDLSVFEADQGHYEQAIVLARKAFALRTAEGARPLSAAANLLHVAEWMVELGRLAEAKTELEAAEAMAVEAVGPEHPRLVEFHLVRASVAAHSGDRKAAEAAFAKATAVPPTRIDDGTETSWINELAWAGMLRALGDEATAITTLRTLLARPAEQRSELRAAEARFELAQLLEKAEPGSSEATVLAEAALRGYRERGRTHDAAGVAAWIADR